MSGGAYVVIAVTFGLGTGIIGRNKGSSFFVWFLVGLFVPIFGMLAALAFRSERAELRRPCPTCGRICMLHDALCVRCGTELEFPSEPVAPGDGTASIAR